MVYNIPGLPFGLVIGRTAPWLTRENLERETKAFSDDKIDFVITNLFEKGQSPISIINGTPSIQTLLIFSLKLLFGKILLFKKKELIFSQNTLSTGFICEPETAGRSPEEIIKEMDYYMHIAVGGLMLTLPQKPEEEDQFLDILNLLLPRIKQKQGTRLFFRIILGKETMDQSWEFLTKAKLMLGSTCSPFVCLQITENIDLKRYFLSFCYELTKSEKKCQEMVC